MNIHFIAIGQRVLFQLALALKNKGYRVSGSDENIAEPAKSRLKLRGLLPENLGWFSDKIKDNLDSVVVGRHVKADNPELLRALDLGIPVFSYPSYLYEQAKNKTRVVIGGSDGKTTITSMILHVMHYHNTEVDYLVTTQLNSIEQQVHLTDFNAFLVIEADDYLASPIDHKPIFHAYRPNIALLSGIGRKREPGFATFENYIEQYQKFVDSIVNGGSITYNAEDELVVEVVSQTEKAIRKFPYVTPNHSVVEGISYLQTSEGLLPLHVLGEQNLRNLSGAKWICQQMGIDEIPFYEAIATFKGI